MQITMQNKMKLRGKDLKYSHLLFKYFKDYQYTNSSGASKSRYNSESLLNEIRQIVYSLYQSKQITKEVYNNIIKSIQ